MKLAEKCLELGKEEIVVEAKKVNGEKMIADMEKAIESNDEKSLLKFMAMDKKNFFSKNNLDMLADEGQITKEQASQLGKLSIQVAQALR